MAPSGSPRRFRFLAFTAFLAVGTRQAAGVVALVAVLATGGEWMGTARAQAPAAVQVPLEQLLQEANGLLRAEQYGAAIPLLEQVLQREPPRATAEAVRLALADAHARAGDPGRAAEAYRAFLAEHPQAAPAPEARLALGVNLVLAGRVAEAIPEFRQLEAVPSLRTTALTYRAEAALRIQDDAEAIAALESLIAGGALDAEGAEAVFVLVSLYFKTGALDRATAALDFLEANRASVDSVARLNGAWVELGDRWMQRAEFRRALSAYGSVRPSAAVEAEQRERIAEMERRLQSQRGLAVAEGSALAESRRRLEQRLAAAQNLLRELSGRTTDAEAERLQRLGRAWLELGRPWEASVLYEELVARHPAAKGREVALFGLLRACADAGRTERAREVAALFQREFPSSPLGDRVTFIAGQLAFANREFAAAEALFGLAADQFRESELRDEMIILLANARFLAGRLDEARQDFERYVREFPDGPFVEEATYRLGMAAFFAGDYTAAVAGIEGYLARYPAGFYVADARYRLAVCAFSARDLEGTVARADAWLRDFPDDGLKSDVHSLRGDALLALGRSDEALAAFTAARDVASSDEVLAYAMNEMTKIWQARGEFDRIAGLYEAFVRERPDHPLVPAATYWIARARVREGREAEAVAFIAEAIARYAAEPGREGVERLITQVTGLVARRPRGVPGGPRPPLPGLPELGRRLEAVLVATAGLDSNTARARLLFARAELARQAKQETESLKLQDAIADTFGPDDLSPGLLALAGERLLARGEAERAEPFFHRLVAVFPKAEFADAGHVGLGRIALGRGDTAAALRSFRAAIDQAGGQTRAREATLGQAQALFEAGRTEEARVLFERIAATREWRGEATAQSVFMLGEIARRGGDLAAAHAHYQRVYVGYRRFVGWVARAYLAAGRALEELGRPVDALQTYRDFARDERLGGLPEAAEITARVRALESTVGGGA